MKRCIKCGVEKPETLEYFPRNKNVSSGFEGRCKKCRDEYFRAYYEKNRESVLDTQKKWREENKERLNEISRQYYRDNRERLLRYQQIYGALYKDKISLRGKKYRIKNAKSLKIAKKKYYWGNKEADNSRSKQWREANKERKRLMDKSYYERNKQDILGKQKIYYREVHKKDLGRIEKQKARAKVWRSDNGETVRLNTNKYRAKKKDLPNNLTLEAWAWIKSQFNNSCAYCGILESEHIAKYNQVLHQEHFVPQSKGGELTHNNIIPACTSCNSSKSNRDFFEWYPEHECYDPERKEFILKFLKNNDYEQQLALF